MAIYLKNNKNILFNNFIIQKKSIFFFNIKYIIIYFYKFSKYPNFSQLYFY